MTDDSLKEELANLLKSDSSLFFKTALISSSSHSIPNNLIIIGFIISYVQTISMQLTTLFGYLNNDYPQV